MRELTVYEIELLIKIFRQQGGSDAELSLLSREMLAEYLPIKEKDISLIFQKEDHPDIKKIKNFKDDQTITVATGIIATLKKKRVFIPLILITLFGGLFFILNLPMFASRYFTEEVTEYEKVREVIRPVMDKSAPLEPGEIVPRGSFLIVPSIAVNAPIVFANSADENMVQGLLQEGVVHYFQTAEPGEIGNSFITGHSSNYWWEKGNYNYVFAKLDKLAVGDQAKIYHEGNKFLYQVRESKIVTPSDTSVLSATETPVLTLMTCTPPGTSWRRLIVVLDQVSPIYTPPSIVEKEVPVTTTLPVTSTNIFFDWFFKLISLF